jgi:hypothetical protein
MAIITCRTSEKTLDMECFMELKIRELKPSIEGHKPEDTVSILLPITAINMAIEVYRKRK